MSSKLEEQEIQAGFVRNRRFLIAISLALASMNVLGLHFEKISLLGNETSVAHPERVLIFVWVGWAWAFAQYVVWFKDVRALAMFKEAIKNDCETALGTAIASRAIVPKLIQVTLYDKLIKGGIDNSNAGLIKYISKFARVRGDGKRTDRVADIEVFGYARLPDDAYERTTETMRFEVVIDEDEWRKHMRVSRMKVFFLRRFTLEYFAPFLIGFAPLIELIYRKMCQ